MTKSAVKAEHVQSDNTNEEKENKNVAPSKHESKMENNAESNRPISESGPALRERNDAERGTVEENGGAI